MKPNFALSLSFEGIKLLHRAAGGWREVGEVSVTSDDLTGELAMLRKTASSLEPAGVRSKLIIPEGQIKYLTIDTVGLSEAACRKAAETALHDATPYEISELAYDISLDGANTHVAAVARETLAEAEAFAKEHRFHPVSFVAVPGDAPYLGEPFFGSAEGAADLLESGEIVEADGIAVVIVGSISAAAAISETSHPEVKAPLAIDTPAPDAIAEKAPVAPVLPSTPAAPTETVFEPEEDGFPLAPPPPKPTSKVAVKPIAQDIPAKQAEGAAALASKEVPQVKPVPSPPKEEPTAIAGAPKKPTFSAATKAPKPTANAQKAAGGFSSRRSLAPTAPKPLGGAQRSPAVAAASTPAPDSSSLNHPTPAEADTTSAPAKAKSGFLSRRKPQPKSVAPAPAPTAKGSETERMTIFGARSDQVGGKPRFLGLIMTIILLVFLAGVAAWAAVFLDEGIAGLMKRNDSRTTASAPENQIDPEIIRTTDGTSQTDATAGEGTQIAALDPVLSAEDTAVIDALQDQRPEPQLPVITEQEAAARYAVTGIWPLAPTTPPSNPSAQSEPVYRSGIDAISNANDAIALPKVQELEAGVQLAAALSPPPFGQTTVIGPRGLIVPTAEGVVAPGGYTLYSTGPPLKPPSTLARFAPQSSTSPPVEAPTTRPSPLIGFRPKPRPKGLIERTERAQLGGVSRLELAAFRPALRPRSLQDRARQAEDARNVATAQAAAAAALAISRPTEEQDPQQTPTAVAPSPIQNATKFATAKSVRPDVRPNNFARIVQRAERAPPKETRVAAAASVAPRTVSPKIPSKASVARSATVKNAINLRKVNLIGVYGKPSSRRALVRLANGRYKKVRVGDRIDGGRISAISNSELRYAKGGRNVILKMP